MKDYAESFYKSKAWQKTRDAYAKSVGNLCERCLAHGYYTPGEIVHHKIHITPQTIKDPNIALNFDNLQLLCRKCHSDIHTGNVKRYKVDGFGRVIEWYDFEPGEISPVVLKN